MSLHQVAVCRELQRVDAVAGEDALDALTALLHQLPEARLEALVARVDVDLLAGLGVFEDQRADRRYLFLARVVSQTAITSWR